MPRRDFLVSTLVATAGSMLAAACAATPTLPTEPSIAALGADGFMISLARFPALTTVGGIAKVTTPAGSIIAIVRTSDAQYNAYWASCPHQGVELNVTSSGFACPNHRAQFDANGAWTGGRVTPNLTSVPLTYDPSAAKIILGVAPPNATPRRQPKVLDIVVANVTVLSKVGGIALFGLGDGYPAALIRTGTAAYLALSPVCTHRSYYVDVNANGNGFICPGHQATFASDGTWTGGQFAASLHVLPAVFDAARGIVSITIP